MKLNEHPAGARAGAGPRRIALISDHASPLAAPGSVDCGGQNVYVGNLARELALAGCFVDVFTRRDAPAQRHPVRPFPHLPNVRVIHVPAGPAHHVPKEQMLPFIPDFARFVARFARRQPAPYDIVHANFFMSGMVAEHLKDTLGIPFVITFHALGHVRRLAQGAADAFPPERTRIETTLMRRADRIIAECAQDRLDMEQLYGAPPSRITIAPCGFDPEELWPVPQAQARIRLGLARERFTILQLGRMVPRKGVDTVIQGLEMLRERHGIDALLLVVGGDHARPDGCANGGTAGSTNGGAGADADGRAGGGADGLPDRASQRNAQRSAEEVDDPEVARLQALARQLGIEAHVRFVGQQPRDALRYYYGAADAFVTTPWYEPFGITPVEAMACARPVVGSEVGGIKSTVIDGVTGFLIPSRDPRALAERLAQLHADPALARWMGEEGLRRAYRHYTWRSVASQAAAVYAAVLDEYRASTPSSLPTL